MRIELHVGLLIQDSKDSLLQQLQAGVWWGVRLGEEEWRKRELLRNAALLSSGS